MDRWEKFNRIAIWMMKLAYANLLWILFTLVGLILFGLFPATVAMFTIVRKWLNEENDFKIFGTFWSIFRTEFFKVNGFALIFGAISYILYVDFIFIQMNEGKPAFLIPVFFFILLSFVMTLLFFFPVYVHYRLKFFEYIKQAFFIAITCPLQTVSIGISVIVIYYIILFIPGIIPLFSGSVFALLANLISFSAFSKIKKRKGIISS
ncbi:YesL family protein [Fredinandcohnia quinoae]|uniref:DUF624 domain-containing protein n=1 Tax=Fredinandcohnia quinoae TaxID=2918902 RepID=A0AAW5E2A2_9BACI|nr:DUF624 domain-containing protein [Fredinandcohnia sp. SECRCQ15]MCH1626488.1 DUF624 domain-containing protein [Fredinandcohnia sp. SECRCQ15]